MAQLLLIRNHVTIRPKQNSIDERFQAFHKANPQIYKLAVYFAREAKRRGFKRYSCTAIIQRLRWQIAMEVGESARINNDYISRYARLVMQNEPDLRGFFRVRQIKAAA